MRHAALLLLLLGGCASSADDELAALKSAHSIVAEWATVARLRAANRVSETYARGMADAARTELATDRGELTDAGDAAGPLLDDLLGGATDPARLAVAARRLGDLETARENR
jgi:hypothetical protein